MDNCFELELYEELYNNPKGNISVDTTWNPSGDWSVAILSARREPRAIALAACRQSDFSGSSSSVWSSVYRHLQWYLHREIENTQ